MTTPHDPVQPPADEPGAGDHPEFARALRALYAPSATVPASLDANILTKARWRLARPISRVLPWALPLSAAAAIALAVWLPKAADKESGRSAAAKPAAMTAMGSPATIVRTGDFDRNGRVDILDAFGLARRVDRGEAVTAAWDLNQDGAVDRRDVDAIAMAAVRLR